MRFTGCFETEHVLGENFMLADPLAWGLLPAALRTAHSGQRPSSAVSEEDTCPQLLLNAANHAQAA